MELVIAAAATACLAAAAAWAVRGKINTQTAGPQAERAPQTTGMSAATATRGGGAGVGTSTAALGTGRGGACGGDRRRRALDGDRAPGGADPAARGVPRRTAGGALRPGAHARQARARGRGACRPSWSRPRNAAWTSSSAWPGSAARRHDSSCSRRSRSRRATRRRGSCGRWRRRHAARRRGARATSSQRACSAWPQATPRRRPCPWSRCPPTR